MISGYGCNGYIAGYPGKWTLLYRQDWWNDDFKSYRYCLVVTDDSLDKFMKDISIDGIIINEYLLFNDETVASMIALMMISIVD
jgi:hypothetical protein